MKVLLEKKNEDLHSTENVDLYSTENEGKSLVTERGNRTIKRMMWKYFTANNTITYINILPDIIENYNNTYHRSIKCTPTFAQQTSRHEHVFRALHGEKYRNISWAIEYVL